MLSGDVVTKMFKLQNDRKTSAVNSYVYNYHKTQFSVTDSVTDMNNWNFSASAAEDAEDS